MLNVELQLAQGVSVCVESVRDCVCACAAAAQIAIATAAAVAVARLFAIFFARFFINCDESRHKIIKLFTHTRTIV